MLFLTYLLPLPSLKEHKQPHSPCLSELSHTTPSLYLREKEEASRYIRVYRLCFLLVHERMQILK